MQRIEGAGVAIRVERISRSVWRVFVDTAEVGPLGPAILAELDSLVELRAGSEHLKAVIFERDSPAAGLGDGERWADEPGGVSPPDRLGR